ncbi:MATE family efflux transporter [Bacillus sp. 165]|uniref:MATE family efflux transporter n=1 Tax=Bacillus sp. 165 TaxID=1529117 RepID=UPI001ADC01D7|nr:MATE family efflux transporter [Bacillus sp. 165]MBO9128379.1 MATE family efflux transporter [Bacillus sp. 165]
MLETHTLSQKGKYFLVLLFPILVTQVTLFAMSFFDTMMSGHASAEDLAGVAIGSSIWIPISTGLTGILLSVTPVVAQLVGAKKEKEVAPVVTQAIYLAFVISLAVLLLGFVLVNPILAAMNLEPTVRDIAKGFLTTLSLGIIPMFVYTVLRCFIDALGQTRVTMVITLCSLPINVLLNYLLIFGNLGFPRLGGIGAGIASAVTYWCILLISVVIIRTKQPFSRFKVLQKFYPVSISAWKDIAKLGIPIGFSIFFETSIFAAVTLLMSTFDTATIAAHQAALNFASMLYMAPLSISMAMTIAVGFEAGAKRYRDARQYAFIGIGTALSLALFFAGLIFIFHSEIAAIYSKEIYVQQLTQQFLMFAILFQVSDAIAAPVQGALRGYKDVNVTLVMTMVAYWVIGLPLGFILANYTPFEAKGYWIGLISGLAFAAVFLSFRLFKLQQRFIAEQANNEVA